MKVLKVTLKQHTPLIHFQPNEPGATLRVSEVKPKLDKYIIEKVGGGNYEAVKERVKINHKDWFGKKKNIYALNYKMSIVPNPGSKVVLSSIEGFFGYRNSKKNHRAPIPAPMFFGNLNGKENSKEDFTTKVFSICDKLSLTIVCYHEELLKVIVQHIYMFFLNTNFGTRQTKGYGSFSIDYKEWSDLLKSMGIVGNQYEPKPYFTVKGDSKVLFTEMEWFYKAIRSGINDCFGQKFYMKSLMFAYAKHEEIKEQWEKKTIKSYFYNFLSRDQISNGQKYSERINVAEIKNHPKGDPLTFTSQSKGKYLFKDCLGLSTVETWKIPYIDNDGTLMYHGSFILNKSAQSTNENVSVQRMKSPILLKPIKEGGGYRVYVIHSDLPQHYLGKMFNLGIDRCKNAKLTLSVYPKFSIQDYFDFMFKKYDDGKEKKYKVNINDLITTGRNTDKAKRIMEIFGELRTTYNKK